MTSGYHWLYDVYITNDNHFYTDHCETLRRRELNYGKLTRAKENTGEPPVLRRQERLLVVTCFLVPLRVTRSGSVFSLILLTFRNIHNVKWSFAIVYNFYIQKGVRYVHKSNETN